MFVLNRTQQEGTPLMDGQVTAGTLVCAIPTHAVSDWLAKKNGGILPDAGAGSWHVSASGYGPC